MEQEKNKPELATVLPRWAAQLLQKAANHPHSFDRLCRIDDAVEKIRRTYPEFFRHG